MWDISSDNRPSIHLGRSLLIEAVKPLRKKQCRRALLIRLIKYISSFYTNWAQILVKNKRFCCIHSSVFMRQE